MPCLSRTGLEGRLEAVQINSPISDKCSYGTLTRDNRSVLVTYGNLYPRQVCLVRFDLQDSTGNGNRWPIGNVVTTSIPDCFRGLNPQEYVLVGLWEERMEKVARWPVVKEVNKYYDPGNMPIFCYFEDDSTPIRGRRMITPRRTIKLRGNYSEIIRKKLPYFHSYSRAVFCESPSQLEGLAEAIRENDLVPIEMKPLC